MEALFHFWLKKALIYSKSLRNPTIFEPVGWNNKAIPEQIVLRKG